MLILFKLLLAAPLKKASEAPPQVHTFFGKSVGFAYIYWPRCLNHSNESASHTICPQFLPLGAQQRLGRKGQVEGASSRRLVRQRCVAPRRIVQPPKQAKLASAARPELWRPLNLIIAVIRFKLITLNTALRIASMPSSAFDLASIS